MTAGALSSVEARDKFRAYSSSRDRQLRDELIESHFGLARVLASRFRGGSEPMEDLVQVASIGLLKAVERYRPELGTSFGSYATPTILGELKRHLRDRTWAFHVPRRDKDLRLQVRDATEVAQHRLARSDPPVRAIAEHAGVSESEARRGQLALRLYNDKPLEPDTAAQIPSTDDDFERVEARAVVGVLVAELPRLERAIVSAYYLEGRSQADIGRQLGRSEMYVSRRLARSRETLRHVAETKGLRQPRALLSNMPVSQPA